MICKAAQLNCMLMNQNAEFHCCLCVYVSAFAFLHRMKRSCVTGSHAS